MAALFRTLGEAVAAGINADYSGTKASEVNAVLGWEIEKTLKQLATLDVAIIRRQNTSVRADRESYYDTYIYDVGIRIRFNPKATEASVIEPYEDLTTELRDFLRPLPYTIGSTLVDTERCDIVVPYDPSAFGKQHVYLSVLELVLTVQ